MRREFLITGLFFGGPIVLLPSLIKSKSWLKVLGTLVVFFGVLFAIYHFKLNLKFSLLLWCGTGVAGVLFITGRGLFKTPKIAMAKVISLTEGLAMIIHALLVAFPLAGIHLLVSDYLWSSQLPVVPDHQTMVSSIFKIGFVFYLFIVFGEIIQHLKADKNFMKVRYSALLRTVPLVLVGAQVYLVCFQLPSWQTALLPVLSYSEMQMRLVFITLGAFCLFAYAGFQPYLHRFVIIVLGFGGLLFATGSQLQYQIIYGRSLEHKGEYQKAIEVYENIMPGLRNVKSRVWLQYHAGLLFRNLDRTEDSRSAFQKVLINFPDQGEITRKAAIYEERLAGYLALPASERNNKKRKAIKGLHTVTEKKAAWCLPNSLGLILNYWDRPMTTREMGENITRTGEGTSVSDAVYYTEMQGLQYVLTSGSDAAMLTRLIDHDLPFLVFVPNHVFAVFGYDQVLETVITYDVNAHDVWEDLPLEDLILQWEAEDRVLGIPVDQAGLKKLKQIFGEDLLQKSEAILQYYLSYHPDNDIVRRMSHLKRAADMNFSEAQREFSVLAGQPLAKYSPDNKDSERYLRSGVPHEKVIREFRFKQLHGDDSGAVDFVNKFRKSHSLSFEFTDELIRWFASKGDNQMALRTALETMDEDGSLFNSSLIIFADLTLATDSMRAREIYEKILIRGESGPILVQAMEGWLQSGVQNAPARDQLNLIEQYHETVGCTHIQAVKAWLRAAEDFKDPAPEKQKIFLKRKLRMKACAEALEGDAQL
jgi:tetratricopeptide (TPR) repeat protein